MYVTTEKWAETDRVSVCSTAGICALKFPPIFQYSSVNFQLS